MGISALFFYYHIRERIELIKADIRRGIRFFIFLSVSPVRRAWRVFLYHQVKDMSTKTISWKLHESKKEVIVRYCHNCGKKTEFHDSGIRRHNANGKLIREYAIFKCEADHTWNRETGRFNCSESFSKTAAEQPQKENVIEIIDTEELARQQILRVDISVSAGGNTQRLDRILASGIKDLSRSRISRMIRKGQVFVDGKTATAAMVIRGECLITVLL